MRETPRQHHCDENQQTALITLLVQRLYDKMEETSKSSTIQHGTDTPHKKASLLGQSAEIRQIIFIYALREEIGPLNLHPYRYRLLHIYPTIDFKSFDQGKRHLLNHPLFHIGHRQVFNEALEAFVLANDFHSQSAAASLFLYRFLDNICLEEGPDNKETKENRGAS